MYGFVASEGVSECYGLVWCSKCPYWKISERQNSTHLTLLKHQNTKTSLYKLSKNHWVIALFKKIGSVRKRLQSTVSLDHPVECNENIAKSTLSQQKISTSHISRRSFGEKVNVSEITETFLTQQIQKSTLRTEMHIGSFLLLAV